MRTLLKIAVILAGSMLTACSGGLTIEHINNNETVVTVSGTKQYLLLPVEDDAPDVPVEFCGEGRNETFFVRLARQRTDFFVPVETAGPAVLKITAPYDAVCWKEMKLSDRFTPLSEPHFRPVYHHAPPYGWMNDPNGMVWHEGEYHLFYQHNPYGSRWQNMTWGHSVSRDLVHWEHLPNALYPDSLGTIFSGSAVIDRDNTAGFGHDAMIAVYTAAGKRQTQCIAWSADRGRTFTKYEGNPVLVKDVPDFRDPKVFWYEPTGRWIMALAVGRNMEFYSSPDLKEWSFESAFGEGYGSHEGVWECPDLFELPLDGDTANRRWVLLCSFSSKVQYFTGDFDGHSFTCDSDPSLVKLMDHGQDHYATVTWSNMPDERTMALAWMSNWKYANDVPTLAFRSANSVPRELGLFSRDGEIWLASKPCAEIAAIRGEEKNFGPFDVASEYNIPSMLPRSNGAYELEMELSDGTAEVYGFKLFNTAGEFIDVCINRVEGTVAMNRMKSGETNFSREFAKTLPAPLSRAESYALRLLVDRASVECFVNGGETVMSNLIFPTEPYNRISFYSKGGMMRVDRLIINELGK